MPAFYHLKHADMYVNLDHVAQVYWSGMDLHIGLSAGDATIENELVNIKVAEPDRDELIGLLQALCVE